MNTEQSASLIVEYISNNFMYFFLWRASVNGNIFLMFAFIQTTNRFYCDANVFACRNQEKNET